MDLLREEPEVSFRVGHRILDRPVRLLVRLGADHRARGKRPLEVLVDAVDVDVDECGGPAEPGRRPIRGVWPRKHYDTVAELQLSVIDPPLLADVAEALPESERSLKPVERSPRILVEQVRRNTRVARRGIRRHVYAGRYVPKLQRLPSGSRAMYSRES